MNCLSIMLSITCFASSIFLQDEKAISFLMERTEVVVIAEVIESHPSPGFWSGQHASVQHVEYRVVEVLKGEVHKDRIDVGHYVVFNDPTADKDNAQLSQEFFKKSNRLVLFLSREKGFGCKIDSTDAGIKPFCCSGGPMVAEAERLEIIRRVLNSGGRNGNN
jgi:hypothetical protein